jgi:hypothetical protein
MVRLGFGRLSARLAHFAPVFFYTKPSSSTSRISSRINFSCGEAYFRADIRTGSTTYCSLITRGFTFAGGSAPSLSLKTSLHYVINCHKLCAPFQDMPACSAFLIKASIASASSSGCSTAFFSFPLMKSSLRFLCREYQSATACLTRVMRC